MKFTFSSVLIVCIAFCQTKAHYQDGDLFDEDAAWLEPCQERFCSRIYDPLCIIYEGAEITIASKCHLQNFRCRAMKRSLRTIKGELPVIRVQYEGECVDTDAVIQDEAEQNIRQYSAVQGKA